MYTYLYMNKLTTAQKIEVEKQLQDSYSKLGVLRKILLDITPKGLEPLVSRKANEVLRAMAIMGMPMRIMEGFRTVERQDALYEQGRTKPGIIVTNARGGESLHNYGVAVDMVFVKEGYNATEAQWKTYGVVARSQGFEWGGDWTGFIDKPHIQLMLKHTLYQFERGQVDYDEYA